MKGGDGGELVKGRFRFGRGGFKMATSHAGVIHLKK